MSDGRSRMGTRLLVLVLVFQGLSGIAGGVGLVGDPSGRALGIPAEWLAGSPFRDYLIPGLLLLIALGVYPLIVAWAVWRRLRWAWRGSALVGAMLLTWIAVQIIVVGYHAHPPLQLIYGLLAVLLLALTLLPTVRRDLGATS